MTAYEQLISRVRDIHLLGGTASNLSWDQEVMMPASGRTYRARQLAQLASLRHGMLTDPRMDEWLAACETDASLMADPLAPAAVNVRITRRDYDRAVKLPASLVQELAQTSSLAKHEWAAARQTDEYARFEPWLAKLLKLCRAKAECFGWDAKGEPWDALADHYEPGYTARDVEAVFTPLRRRLVQLIGMIAASPRRPSDRFIHLKLPLEQQQHFVRFVLSQIGFDLSRGRLDVSTHPFCSGSHVHDVRLTTRFHEDNVLDALGSSMHEAGHGIYNQNLPTDDHIDTPMGQPVSLSIHESQSRMWENLVGRSAAFWQWCFPKLHEFFGEAAGGLSFDEVYGAANLTAPSLIRVEADETTYNLHIMVRFELERAMMSEQLSAADLPAAWNEKYKAYLDLDVPDDRRGCLQDIHWSMGAIGYFPTYTLGNLYAAQFFETAQTAMPDLFEQFAQGHFDGLRQWLTENIYQHGMRYDSEPLCRHITGQPLSADPLMRHLEGKLRSLYSE